jgi:arylsulfatase A-like enzyme
MRRRDFLATTAAAALAQTEPAPNIVFLIFDKCRTDALGAYGRKDVHTPNLDWIASTGVRFANCFTPQALCGPARASILTGLYPHAHGLRRNVYPFRAGALNSNYPDPIVDPFRDSRFRLWENFPFYLHNAGYETAHIGKWHLGPGNPGFFDTWKSFNSTLTHWIGEPHQSDYRPDVHTTQGIDFLERNASRRFFLYLSYYAPHEPDDPPKQFLEHYRGKNVEHEAYYASVSNLDWNVGRLLDTLRKRNLLDRTLLIVTTEHGRTWRDRPGTSEGLCIPYEEVSRIPLLMRCPGLLPAGAVWQSGVSLVDLMPTILEAARVIPTIRGGAIHGRSLLPDLRAKRDLWRGPILMQNIPQLGIDGSYYDERTIRTERWKLILRKFDVRPEVRPGELYDLQADPEENRNLYGSNRAAVRELAGALRQWGEEHQDHLSLELGRWAGS